MTPSVKAIVVVGYLLGAIYSSVLLEASRRMGRMVQIRKTDDFVKVIHSVPFLFSESVLWFSGPILPLQREDGRHNND